MCCCGMRNKRYDMGVWNYDSGFENVFFSRKCGVGRS